MHGCNGYKVTNDDYSVRATRVHFMDFADAKLLEKGINIGGDTVKVTEQIQKFWIHFRRIDKEFATDIVRNYKIERDFSKFAESLHKLERHDDRLVTEALGGYFRERKVLGKHHILTFACEFGMTISGRAVISINIDGPWHTFKDWPVTPAASFDEPFPFRKFYAPSEWKSYSLEEFESLSLEEFRKLGH